jgi:hypothetical protein
MPIKLTQEEFEERVIKKYGKGAYILTKTVYKTAKEDIVVECHIHGEFKQKAGSFLEGHGCQKCGRKKGANKRTKSTEKFIKDANKIEVHKNKYSYEKTVYVSCDEKVIITCKKPGHGDFLQSPTLHLKGHGCPKCAIDFNSNNIRYTNEEFISMAKKIHPESNYDYSKTEYINSKTDIIIICKKLGHGEFQQTPSTHLKSKYGCPKCAIEFNSNNSRYTNEEFISMAKEKHPQNNYDYSKTEFVNSNCYVIIICKKPGHGEFQQRAGNHLQCHGCPKCAIEFNADIRTRTTEQFIEETKKVHGEDTYDYSKTEYVNCKCYVTITCKKPGHGDFQQTPDSHLQGVGCPKCGKLKRGLGRLKPFKDFVKEARLINGDFYTYVEETYTKHHEEMTIICPNHGAFNQKPVKHLQGHGCTACSSNGYSRIQIVILNFLASLWNIDIKHAENSGEYKINGKKVDGYCEETKTVIEVHGGFWHGDPKIYPQDEIHPVLKKTYGELYRKTKEKDEKIKKSGYNLKIIWVESEWIVALKSIKKIQRIFREKRQKR